MYTAMLLALLTACGQPAPADAPPGAEPTTDAASKTGADHTTIAGLKAAMDAGEITLIDVRTPAEFAAGHVPGALPVPLSELEARLPELAAHKQGDVYMICASGGRSGRAVKLLAREGFRHPINVEGGTRAWVAAGHAVDVP